MRKTMLACIFALGGGIVLLIAAILIFPSRDYMKMSFSEKVCRGYSANILINGDSIGAFL